MNNYSVVYFTSWGTGDVKLSRLSPSTTHLNLSFASVESDFSVVASDGLLKYNKNQEPSDLYWIEPEYVSWTQYKYNNPNTKMILAFGGATYGAMWELLQNEANVSGFASALKSVLDKEYPVYIKPDPTGGQYEKVGYVKLDGVDLDFELAGRPSDAQCKNLAAVISEFKRIAPNKIISLTGYHTSADPIECQFGGTTEQGCSYPAGSAHAGELIPFFNYLVKEDLDFYNLMAYDADRNYDWKTAMANHAHYLGKNKVVLGLSLGSQWGANGNFAESLDDLLLKTKEQKALGYPGIMVWAVGATELVEVNKNEQVDKINQIIATLNS